MVQLANLRVLIADDHMLMRQLVRVALRESRITNVHTAADGNEAIDLIQKAREHGKPYHIVLLDWNMPITSGMEVLTYFRTKREYADTAFVMLTANTEQQSVMTAIRFGATSYITKPVSTADLIKRLSEIRKWMEDRDSQPRL